MNRSRQRSIYAAVPVAMSLLLLVAGLATATDLHHWMPRIGLMAPFLLSAVLMLCTLLAWLRPAPIYWRLAGLAGFLYLSLSFWLSFSGVPASTDVLSLAVITALLALSVLSIRALTRLRPNNSFKPKPLRGSA